MERHVSGINHTGLTLTGLVLLAAGGAGLAYGFGAFGSGTSDDPLLSGSTRSFAAEQDWFWPVVAVAAVVAAVLGLAWLLAQARSDRLPGLALEPDTTDGSTKLSAKAVTEALEDEVGEYPGVRGVKARLTGSGKRPRLRLNVAYGRDADLAALRDRIADQAVPRLCGALERDTLPTTVRLRLVSHQEERAVD